MTVPLDRIVTVIFSNGPSPWYKIMQLAAMSHDGQIDTTSFCLRFVGSWWSKLNRYGVKVQGQNYDTRTLAGFMNEHGTRLLFSAVALAGLVLIASGLALRLISGQEVGYCISLLMAGCGAFVLLLNWFHSRTTKVAIPKQSPNSSEADPVGTDNSIRIEATDESAPNRAKET
jgi:hypothetical protein